VRILFQPQQLDSFLFSGATAVLTAISILPHLRQHSASSSVALMKSSRCVRKSDILVARPEFKDQGLEARFAVSTLFGTDQRAAEEILRARLSIDFTGDRTGDAPIEPGPAHGHRRGRGRFFAV
jgi:hypothetical protein